MLVQGVGPGGEATDSVEPRSFLRSSALPPRALTRERTTSPTRSRLESYLVTDACERWFEGDLRARRLRKSLNDMH